MLLDINDKYTADKEVEACERAVDKPFLAIDHLLKDSKKLGMKASS